MSDRPLTVEEFEAQLDAAKMAREDVDRFRAALESIASLPGRFGIDGAGAAIEAVRIAKAALRQL